MHRSRIGLVLIDHPVETYDAAAAFWAGARGSEPRGALDPDDPFQALDALGGGVGLELQRIGAGTPARIHLDIETDDVWAEVARVEALGAGVTERHDDWAVLVDPGGLPFCVVPVQTGDDFAAHATTWD